MDKKHIRIGLILTIIFLLIHLAIMPGYGLTWDFHHHFFAGMHLLKQPITPDLVAHLPFTEPDPRGTYKLPFGPLMSIGPVASYLIFFKQLGMVSFDNAYNLSIVISGVAGIFILFLFLLEAEGLATAVVGFIFLALLPRYFGDLHNNMKDVPQAAAFTLAIWLFWRLTQHKRPKDLVLACLAFAIAFNTKVNTVMVPVIAGAWLLLSSLPKLIKQKSKLSLSKLLSPSKLLLAYFIFAPLSAFLLWSFFWDEPIKQLLYIPQFFLDNTQNIEVLLNGHWYCSGRNVPWFYPLWYLAITTPIPILIFFIFGLFTRMRSFFQPSKLLNPSKLSLLLFLWFFFPIIRYIHPKMGVIDGIRHFEEVLFPLVAIAAIGFMRIVRMIMKFTRVSKKIRLIFITVVFSFIIYHLSFIIISYHPFQISYYNELVGGIRGAWNKYDVDYWGGPQKIAVNWLNAIAPNNSTVYIAMGADVAGKYLRPDLLARLNVQAMDTSDYTIVLNRQSFFYRFFYLYEYLLTHKPIHTISVDGVPVVWIFDNRNPTIPRLTPWWKGEDPCIKKYW